MCSYLLTCNTLTCNVSQSQSPHHPWCISSKLNAPRSTSLLSAFGGSRTSPVWYPKIICTTGQGWFRIFFPWASGRAASFWGSSWRLSNVSSNVWEAQGGCVLAHELPSRWVNVCSLQKKWGASQSHPVTEFKNPIHPSYTDTKREGHVCRSPTVPAWVGTPEGEPPSTRTHRAGPTWEKTRLVSSRYQTVLWFYHLRPVLPIILGCFFFFFFRGNSTGSEWIHPILSQKAKLISPSNILGFAPDEQLV